MLLAPFYDPLKSYEENLEKGPFNAFTDEEDFRTDDVPRFELCGVPVNYPFGIPAGPLLDSKYVMAALKKGFDIPVYKTVRADVYPCHPFPNVLAARVEGELLPDNGGEPLVVDQHFEDPISITNSFGVPSRAPEVWQQDAKAAIAAQGNGQVMIMSFMGTVREGQTAEEFIADYAEAAKLANATGASILEVNLSCPNIGNEGLVCYNADMTRRVATAIRDVIGKTPLILKVGYYKDDAPVEELIKVADEYAQGISAINTIQATVVDAEGNQALPGPMRARSGVCGASIKWAGLEMTARLKRLRDARGSSLAIIGVGGVCTPADFREYRDAGADVVMSATGAMWNPYLAKEIRAAYPDA